MRVLAVDDELPALDDLVFLLRSDPRVADVDGARDGAAALRALDRALAAERPYDAVFLDVRMPGLDGIVLGRLLAQFACPPRLVYVTAHEEHAVQAFEIQAADYLLKPVRPERLAETVRRITEGTDDAAPAPPEPEPLPVELSGVTRFVHPSEVHYVEARGDYAKLHTASGAHLVRIPLTALEERWPALVRIHRSHLVAVPHISELRLDAGRCTVVVAGTELPVSRRHTRQLRDLLLRRPRP
ncbi:LytTR family DNA-binding domain-containing protein [Actinocorallia sp. A-T 12471]|uniref:LytR/AlgR family response regulator transcription factor n=1 Tax=Actinocorallia sp. A-T 12471 TaxID=3089813 RepID=UPI0029CCF235|nr:LytTR family DNA-binding domain-containing protein [Actinocorallia sp. A-T 12471]MDX6739332.1 LytTR family DNA-binding domain-containing protein [Actinocorallia sp. A-T 12471]